MEVLIVLLIIIFSVSFIFFVIPWFYGAPYDTTRKKSLKNIIKLTNPKTNDFIAELGSGDGRVCIALAQKNNHTKIHGYEINPFLVMISRNRIKKLNLQKQIKIYWKNFWKINLSKYNKIVFFQFSTITKRLEKKFNEELKPKTKIVSHNWKLPNWKIKKQLGKKGLTEGKVYLYEK